MLVCVYGMLVCEVLVCLELKVCVCVFAGVQTCVPSFLWCGACEFSILENYSYV